MQRKPDKTDSNEKIKSLLEFKHFKTTKFFFNNIKFDTIIKINFSTL